MAKVVYVVGAEIRPNRDGSQRWSCNLCPAGEPDCPTLVAAEAAVSAHLGQHPDFAEWPAHA